MNRRRFLQGVGGVAGAALLGLPADRAAAVAATTSADGLTAWSMAMHVHSSFSEGPGSMDSQLQQAASNHVDVLWWTDHEWKMHARHFKSTVHFTSLTDEQGDGTPWVWVPRRHGPLTARSRGGIAAVGSPHDPVPDSSLLVRAESSTGALARLGFEVDGGKPKTQRVNAYGQVWTVDVLPQSIGRHAYLEMLVTLSLHPARAGRPKGQYRISYRFGGPRAPHTRVARGLLGIVTLPATQGRWNTTSVTMSDDIAALWPDLNPRDFATYSVGFYASSQGGLASGCFDYLRISRPFTSGDVPLRLQGQIARSYAARYPSVAQRQGIEVSLTDPHLNWFGGAVTIPTFVGGQGATWEEFLATTVRQAHRAGGLISYNHPYGAANLAAALPAAKQDAAQSAIAAHLLTNRALGADLLEVGYPQRAGYDLAHHLALWDTMSRNAVFLTGNGVNDDHGSTDWRTPWNNWVTWVWAANRSEAHLLAALKSGRAWASSLGRRIALDLHADGGHPMGSVSVSSVRRRSVRVSVRGLPRGGSVQVLRGVVDYAGTQQPRDNVRPVALLDQTALATGSATLSIDTTSSCFVRLSVRNGRGAIVAVSNPVWLLRAAPPTGIPGARAA